MHRYCLCILGDKKTLEACGSVWAEVVKDSESRGFLSDVDCCASLKQAVEKQLKEEVQVIMWDYCLKRRPHIIIALVFVFFFSLSSYFSMI